MKTEVQILLDLVAIPSVSSVSNQPVVDYVRARLDPPVWKVGLYPYRDAAGTRKVNLVALTKNGRGKTAACRQRCARSRAAATRCDD